MKSAAVRRADEAEDAKAQLDLSIQERDAAIADMKQRLSHYQRELHRDEMDLNGETSQS